jgi:hypothetical protein
MCAISGYIQRSDVEDSEKKNQRKKDLTVQKVDTYSVTYSVCVSDLAYTYSVIYSYLKKVIKPHTKN